MSMIDPFSPTFTFSYDKLDEPVYKYVRDRESEVHRIKVTEYVTSRVVGGSESKYVYAKYEVQVSRYLEDKVRRVMNVIFDKEDLVEKYWYPIEAEFYSRDFYSEYMPSGMVQQECLYDTYEQAQIGEQSYIFRDYNLKDS